ncbi:rod shape-determining protein MreC [Zooshikella harenae]|uniref:Cell shape-determining protein MreC n=1 Tax=Zooshikella harenae TaxID=2827238 RepID=A0ABS5Z7R6_9GAMM|nr:rod shape-determining protein MreC [Zooshikella harenae]MBU2710090.1 rod shape-determining protein MreC [Zooshikella harenae]
MKSLFVKQRSLTARLFLCVVLSVASMIVDHKYNYLDTVRAWLTVIVTPVQWVADIPARMWGMADNALQTRAELLEENARLEAKNLILERKLQKLAALTAQNIRLRELLNSSRSIDEKVLIAELMGIDPNPYTHQVIVNKGSLDGVYVGQPLLDAKGLMGQVITVSPFSSRIMLITDAHHSIPVQVNRNGVRAIAVGTGKLDELELRHVPDTTDIRQGDILVSSGLGQKFPVGYPVGEVISVIHDPGKPFAVIKVRPAAKLDRSRHVLLVFTHHQTQALADEFIQENQRDATES